MWTTRYTLPPPTSVHLVSRMPHSTLHPTPPFPPFTLGCNATFPRRIPLHTSTNTRTLPLFTRATKPHTRRLHARTSHFAHDFPRGFPPSHSPSSPLIAGFYVRSRWRWRPCRRLYTSVLVACSLYQSYLPVSLPPSVGRSEATLVHSSSSSSSSNTVCDRCVLLNHHIHFSLYIVMLGIVPCNGSETGI